MRQDHIARIRQARLPGKIARPRPASSLPAMPAIDNYRCTLLPQRPTVEFVCTGQTITGKPPRHFSNGKRVRVRILEASGSASIPACGGGGQKNNGIVSDQRSQRKKMSQRIPDLIRPISQDYLFMLNKQLPGLTKALYLEGSIALGGFNKRFSDIDFVSCLDRQPDPAEIDTLRSIHEVIKDRHSQWQMQGSYIQFDDLGCWGTRTRPDLTYHDGELRPGGSFEPQSVEGWIVKNQGIALMGPDPRDLPFTVGWDSLNVKMRENLNTYWAGWARRPDRFIVMLSDWGIQWAVLGTLRQFYSFRENSITTKSKAGEYALTCVPTRWHRLIREALDIREGKTVSAYRFKVIRAGQAVRFLRFIIRSCNANPMDVSRYA